MGGYTMNKSELAKEIATRSQYDITATVAEDMINCFMDSVIDEVSAGGKVQLVGFGTFETSNRTERTCKNPQTGEQMTVPACTVPKFKAGKAFKEAVN